MKTHMMGDNYITFCGLYLMNITNGESSFNTEDVTCENCKRTDAYRDAKAKQKRKDIDELKDIREYVQNDETPTTYKQKVEIEIEVPVGMEFDRSEFLGEAYDGSSKDYSFSFKKKVKTGSELIGCLCGLSDVDKYHAKEAPTTMSVVDRYDGTYCCGAEYYEYAYPVSPEKLDELKKELAK